MYVKIGMFSVASTFVLLIVHSSERVGKTKVAGTLLAEAKYINLSLHYLEQVSNKC